ncbi:hypothetical protein HN018_14415 [Lichenicola cladoniae]|uniref:Uncharacterized protein n=1 Tax=Lichenicola cladoniae TaxID=1484109 RepID=A0A6M8HRZ0_9PROT|nr:hypothetical protein [Lichenicola cladoniae]NPD65929.1 hypothetical protein [Acetobacteraceae bacterium]QKE91080.1 hypothetical protein HN018_14415 [Lichenicola cladoniae]
MNDLSALELVFVTGSRRGIGAAVCRNLADDGDADAVVAGSPVAVRVLCEHS